MPWFLALLLSTAPTCTEGRGKDRILLKNGKELHGELVSVTGPLVTLEEPDLGTLTLPRTHIRAVIAGDSEPDLYRPLAPTGLARDSQGYMRFEPPVDEQPGSLLTGVSRLHHAQTDTTLFLVGAVHIAEQAYFEKVQAILDSNDVVLFEGVSATGEDVSEEDVSRFDALFKLQMMMVDLLGLRFQKDCMQYERNFWKNADVDMAALNQEMKRRNVSLPTDNPLFRLLVQSLVGTLDVGSVKPHPELTRQLRRTMAPMLAMSEKIFQQLNLKGFREVLIQYRNDAALEALAGELTTGPPGRWIALFYGAAHLPDLEEKLLASTEWTLQGVDWLSAWTVD